MRHALIVIAALVSLSLAACGGGSGGASGPPPDVTPSTVLTLKAKNIKFDKKALATIANADVVLTLDNQDRGVLHNFALYRDQGFREKVFVGDLFPGKKTLEYRFRAPDQGAYYFRCDAHPDMRGTFTVKPQSN